MALNKVNPAESTNLHLLVDSTPLENQKKS